MVFREETMIQVKDMVKGLEHQPRKSSPLQEVALKRSSSLQERPTQNKLPNTRHARSCLASGLFHSVYKGRLKKVKFLLDNGLNVNAKNDYGYNVLVAALHIENNDKRRKMFHYLLENDADPLQKDPRYKRNTLGWAAILGRHEQANLLLDLFMGEFNFHEKDRDGMTPLHLATQAGHTEVVKSLVREMVRFGTLVDVPDNLGLTPYLHAKRLGYGLIADILKVEGGACEGQADIYTFKRADEWRKIGIQERNSEVKRRRNSQYEKAAIAGSARMLMEFEGPGYEIISIPTPRGPRKHRHAPRSVSSDVDMDDSSGCKPIVRIKSPRSQVSLPAGIEFRSFRNRQSLLHTPMGNIDANSPRLDTMSLIQMREPKKGMAPKQFRSSEVDSSKSNEYKNVVGDITTMMDYLEMRHSKSFRRSVPPLKLHHEEPASAQKMSSLAVLFGKGKKGRRSSRSPGSAGKKKEKTGSENAKQPHKASSHH